MTKARTPMLGLLVGALGVVFGDIGTSPLYVMKVVFGEADYQLPITRLAVLGLISLILWTVTLVVSVKYIMFIMRADNAGEGGIMALVARVRKSPMTGWHKPVLVFLGLLGVALFYGDSAITPAISVLSAVEGISVVDTRLSSLVLPLTVAILIGLFWIQKYGTATIGKVFGPVMLLWFLVIAAGGINQIVHYPAVLQALNPFSALQFARELPLTAFTAMGAVVLAITGAEALYADMGHFGRAPIARSWFLVVFPALALCYMGQGALLLTSPEAVNNPFYLLFPAAVHIPLLVLAAAATLIASQSVISGAFSLTRQAVQLNFLPRMRILHTSDRESGQIYVPMVNLLLFLVVMLVVLLFESSVRLAGAYGIAVSGAIAVDSILFFALAFTLWRAAPVYRWLLAVLAGVFLCVDIILVSANLSKIVHGGWVPLLAAAGVLLVIDTWRRGQRIVVRERKQLEGPLQTFITRLHQHELGDVSRVPGQAVFIGHHPGLTPLALHAAVEKFKELPDKVAIVYVQVSEHAHVPEHERAQCSSLEYADGVSQVVLTFGYHDAPNVPRELERLRGTSPELDFDPYAAAYFISLTEVIMTTRHNLAPWRKSLYSILDRNKLSSGMYYKLPFENTTELRALIKL